MVCRNVVAVFNVDTDLKEASQEVNGSLVADEAGKFFRE
jgi:hypothetical protein